MLWFRIPRVEGDPAEQRGVVGRGGAVVAINREDYWQVALVFPKGTADAVRSAGLESFRARIAALAPWTSTGRSPAASRASVAHAVTSV